MIHQQTEPDDGNGRSDASDLYGALVLEIDATIADGAGGELSSASLVGLTAQELNQLGEVRECLQMLYRTARDHQRSDSRSTPSFSTAVDSRKCGTSKGDEVAGAGGAAATYYGASLGRFEVIREIGAGGHGVVFLARDPTLNRLVALKVPQPEVLLTPTMRWRFLTEGRAAAILTHPNIVPVYEAGEIGPVCYLAQAYVGGMTLAEWLKHQAGAVAPDVAAEIVAQIAEGIEHAHDRGILHRDLKPGNVLLDMESVATDGGERSLAECNSRRLPFVPKITDFGIAKSLASDGDETAMGTILGTPSYMSPEQAMGKIEKVGPMADVYSLGAILYELLTGITPFRGDTFGETVRLVTTTDPAPPRRLRQDLSRDLEAICLKCLEKDPTRRYASAFELAMDLRRFLAGEPTKARPIKSRERMVRWCRRKPAIAGLIGISFVMLVALMSNIVWSKSRLEELLVQADEQRKLAVQREEIAREHVYASDMATAQEAWYRGSLSSAAEILAQHLPSSGQSDLRGIEWQYLTHLVDNASQMLSGHTGRLGALCYSPDGKLLASGAADGTIHLWDAKTNELIRTWSVPDRKEVNAIAFSPDGQTLVAATDESKVRLWNIFSGQEVAVLDGHTGWVGDVCFSPDGKLLASAGSDKSVRLWDVGTGKQKFVLEGHRDIVRGTRFLLGGALLASTSEDQTVRLWNVLDGSLQLELPLNAPYERRAARPTSMAVSPDGKSLAVCLEATFVRTWSVALPGILEPMRDFADEEVRCVAFCADGKSVVIGTNDAKIQEWNIATDAVERVLRGHEQQVLIVAASPSGEEVASGSRNGHLRIWNSNSGQAYRRLANIPWMASAIAVSRDGASLVIGGDSTKYVVLDAKSGSVRHIAELPPKDRDVFVGEWIVSIYDEKTFRIRDAATGRLLQEFPNEFGAVGRVAPSPDGTGLLVAAGRVVNLIDLQSYRLQASLLLSSSVRCIDTSPDGKLVAFGAHNGELWICDAADLRVERKLLVHTDGVASLAFSSTEPLICSESDDYSARLWNWQSGEQVRTLASLEERFGMFAFSRDGRTVIGKSSKDKVCTWNVKTGRKTLQILFPGLVADIALSPDGQMCYVLHRLTDATSEIDLIEFGVVVQRIASIRM